MGPKILGIPVVDEVGAVYFVFSKLKSGQTHPTLANINKLLFVYLAIISIVGSVSYLNPNALRFFVIAVFFLAIGSDARWLRIGALITAAKAYCILYFAIVLAGEIAGLQVAYWQDYLWAGTTYAAVGSFLAVWVWLMFASGWRDILLALLLYLATAVMADSRLQLLLGALLLFPILTFVSRKKKNPVLFVATLFVSVSAATATLSIPIDVEVSGPVANLIESASLTANAFVSGETEDRDQDRLDSNLAAVSWVADNPILSVTGLGILSHQRVLGRYVDASADERVRPVGTVAVLIDGGLLLAGMIVAATFVSTFQIIGANVPLLPKLAAVLLPLVMLIALVIVNLLDSVVFWLVVSPSGFLPAILEEWRARYAVSTMSTQTHGGRRRTVSMAGSPRSHRVATRNTLLSSGLKPMATRRC